MTKPEGGPIRRALRSIVTLHGSPEAIALGTAIGVFIAFTPTIGFQMLLGAFVATLVGASRPAAMIPAWRSSGLIRSATCAARRPSAAGSRRQ